MEKRRVVITGLGTVNPLGLTDTGYYGIIILKPVLEIMNRGTVSIRKSEMPQIIILFMGKIWMR